MAPGPGEATVDAKRWIGTLRRELLNWILILNRRHLEHVLAEYVTHFNQHRPTAHSTRQHRSERSHHPRHRPTYTPNVVTGSAA